MDTEESPTATDPVTALGLMREHGPVVPRPGFGARPSLIVTRYEDVAALLTDPRVRCDHRTVDGAEDTLGAVFARLGIPTELGYLERGLLTRDGADHMRLRKLVSRAFTVRRVEELRPRVEELAGELLDDIAGPEFDLMSAYAFPLSMSVICELVGVPAHRRDAWQEIGRLIVAPDPERMATVAREVVGGVEELIEARRAAPADDLITGLVRAHDGDDRLTASEITTMVFDLVVAGHETTARLIGTSVLALLTRPDQLAALRADPDLWPGAVHELVRTCGPVPTSLPRHAAEDLEIGGTAIPAGSSLLAGLLPANLDPRAYDRPEELDVRRDTGPGDGHLGFGRGPHYCLGAALARQETEVALRSLVERFGSLHLVDPPDGPSTVGFRLLSELRLRTERSTVPAC